jgi:hypothetical protein
VFEKTSLPFLTIIFLTSRAGLLGRRGENVANVGTRLWLRHFHKGESKTQDVVWKMTRKTTTCCWMAWYSSFLLPDLFWNTFQSQSILWRDERVADETSFRILTDATSFFDVPARASSNNGTRCGNYSFTKVSNTFASKNVAKALNVLYCAHQCLENVLKLAKVI